MKTTSSEIEALTIQRWASGGDGVGIVETGPMAGMVFFVPDTVPGDLVRVRIVKKKKRWGRGLVEERITESPRRRSSPCSYQDRCGGCPWMPGTPPLQSEARLEALRGEVRKRLSWSEEALVKDVLSGAKSGPELGYRHRLRMAYRRVGEKVFLGFRGAGTNHIVDVETCVVASPAIQAVLPSLRERLLELGEGKGEVWLVSGGDEVAGSIEPEHQSKVAFGSKDVRVPVSDGHTLRAHPSLFVQANPHAVVDMSAHIEALAREAGGKNAVELFGGAGTFTLPLLKAGYSVQSYESNPSAQSPYEELTRDLGEAQFKLCNLYKEREPVPAPPSVDLVLSDPPRTGASDLIPWVVQSKARTVIWIACDVATGLRDASLLIEQGYELSSIRSFDMFPNTGHQELIMHFVLAA